MLVGVLLENWSEERRAGRQDELVCLDLSGATAESAVKQILLFSDLPEGQTNVALKIIPAKAKLITGTHHNSVMQYYKSWDIFVSSVFLRYQSVCKYKMAARQVDGQMKGEYFLQSDLLEMIH